MDSKESQSLSVFLRNIADAVDAGTVSEVETDIIRDFYMHYNLKVLDVDEAEIKKYLTYGWFLNSLIKKI